MSEEITKIKKTAKTAKTPVAEKKAPTKKVAAEKKADTKKTPAKKAPAKKAAAKGESVKRQASVSGKYRSVRSLMDELFGKKGDKLTFEDTEKLVAKEFPQSKYNKAHFAWYRNHILIKKEKGKRDS